MSYSENPYERITMFRLYTRTFTKKVHFKSKPTAEIANTLYEEYEPENLQDRLVTAFFHRYLLQKIKSGFVKKPGTYKMSCTVSFPIMFWHRIYFEIERL